MRRLDAWEAWLAEHHPDRDHVWIKIAKKASGGGPWSQINSARAEELIAAGRVRPAGMAAIEAAKADGRWNGGS